MLVLCGEPLRATDQRVLEAFAVQTGLVLEYRRLREREERAATLERAEATSTALLRAVSHDLRTPLATMRAAVDGLVSRVGRRRPTGRSCVGGGRVLDRPARAAHRQPARPVPARSPGCVHPVLRDRSLDEVLPLAVAGHPPGAVVLEVDESTPLVRTDAGLLERVVANLVANAVRGLRRRRRCGCWPTCCPTTVEVLVVDRGPGVPPAQRERMFEPFQRLDDTSPGGLGLGLAVARGLTEAVGGTLSRRGHPRRRADDGAVAARGQA